MSGFRRRVKHWKREAARDMRRNPADGEAELWSRLQARRCAGLKFRRQAVALGWILDFYCPSKRLAVEVDGGYHAFRVDADRTKDTALANRHGIRVLRFTVGEVQADLDSVVAEIARVAQARPTYRSGSQNPMLAVA